MDFSQDRAVMASEANLRQYVGQMNAVPMGNATAQAPPESLNSIQMDSLKMLHELNAILSTIGDALGGSRPENPAKEQSGDSLLAKSQQIKRMIAEAQIHAQRIGSFL